MSERGKILGPTLYAVILVALVAFGVYANSLTNGLHVDDKQQIIDNSWIKDPANLGEIFTSGVWDHAGRVSSYYRPLMYVTYMGTYAVAGLAPWAYHLVNVLFHVGVSVLVFFFARRIITQVRGPGNESVLVAAAAGLLFAAHPIHTEAVAWAAGVTDLSFTLFYLAAALPYLGEWRPRWLRLVASATLYLLAMLCKEPAITLPAVLLAYELLLRRERVSIGGWVQRGAPYLVAAGVYLGLRAQALGGLVPTTTGVEFSLLHYVLNVLALFSRYLEALVVPVGLNFWHVFRPLESIASWGALRALLVTGAFAGVCWWAWKRQRAVLFGAAVIVVGLSPAFHVSALNQGLENAFAERYLYLPSVGFVIMVAAALAALVGRRPSWRPALAASLLLLIGIYSLGTIRRNPVWKTSLSLWADAARKSPESAIAHVNYGFALLHHGDQADGEQHLEVARNLDPNHVQSFIQRGVAYSRKGMTMQAILEFHKALTFDPGHAPAHYSLGVVYEQRGWRDQAMGHYLRAVELDTGHAEAHNNLGILYAESGDLGNAERHFEAAVAADPSHPNYRANLERLRGR